MKVRYHVVKIDGGWEIRDRQNPSWTQRYVSRSQARIAAWMRNNPEPKKVEAALPKD